MKGVENTRQFVAGSLPFVPPYLSAQQEQKIRRPKMKNYSVKKVLKNLRENGVDFDADNNVYVWAEVPVGIRLWGQIDFLVNHRGFTLVRS